CGDDRAGGFGRGALQAHDEDVGIVPASGTLGDPRVPRERGADARDLVRSHRSPRSGPAEEQALVGLAGRDGARNLLRDVRPLVAVEQLDLVPALAQLADGGVERLALVVGADHELHPDSLETLIQVRACTRSAPA